MGNWLHVYDCIQSVIESLELELDCIYYTHAVAFCALYQNGICNFDRPIKTFCILARKHNIVKVICDYYYSLCINAII